MEPNVITKINQKPIAIRWYRDYDTNPPEFGLSVLDSVGNEIRYAMGTEKAKLLLNKLTEFIDEPAPYATVGIPHCCPMPPPIKPVIPAACVCPKCGSYDVKVGEYVWRDWPHPTFKPLRPNWTVGTITITSGTDEVCWEHSKDECLYCNKCDTEYPIPRGWEVECE